MPLEESKLSTYVQNVAMKSIGSACDPCCTSSFNGAISWLYAVKHSLTYRHFLIFVGKFLISVSKSYPKCKGFLLRTLISVVKLQRVAKGVHEELKGPSKGLGNSRNFLTTLTVCASKQSLHATTKEPLPTESPGDILRNATCR